jgi:hypothetical protein
MARFDGYLFSKLHLIGSKSEGPTYILQQWDYSEIPVVKKVMPWKEDPKLHEFLARKVTIKGKFGPEGIAYDEIRDLQPPILVEKQPALELDLRLETDILWVNKMPPTDPQMKQTFDLTLLVKWPYRSIWHGLCPTSQIYDFFIEREGEIIWQWSWGKVFAEVTTLVAIPGGGFVEFPVTWVFSPAEIESEGTYTASALFIASGQGVSKDFEIRFAY